ncbi:MAG: gluconate 2-dehydrogenase subunit 3 family protein [Acidobacteria bacterium]|nr:gluconate 2-dehydrogenase subunit 3 family protein [Acidobacteriota bacterium]
MDTRGAYGGDARAPGAPGEEPGVRAARGRVRTRREFLQRAMAVGGGAALWQAFGSAVPAGVRRAAAAVLPDTRATIEALVEMVVPGLGAPAGWNDGLPGGPEAGITDFMIYSLDNFLYAPAGQGFAPMADVFARGLDAYSLQASGKRFADATPRERVDAMALMDEGAPAPLPSELGHPSGVGTVRFAAGALVEFTAFGYYSEWEMFGSRSTTCWHSKPVPTTSWEQVGYRPSHGHADFRGYDGGKVRTGPPA